MRGASTFTDTAAAQRFVQAVVDANTTAVREWLAHGRSGRLRLNGYFPGEPTGRMQVRGMLYAGRGPVDVHGVAVVLKRSDAHANGFVVLTAYPTWV
ncbi:RNase A-like domain-containing protein [Actinomadura napierensis]|uniref:Bacterial CdiA-CT RNAse A domain-containing protein n=1 Tax=Actinomadura napierensis TaxID=267854 RepID=A0ABN2ZYX3_9ACTN